MAKGTHFPPGPSPNSRPIRALDTPSARQVAVPHQGESMRRVPMVEQRASMWCLIVLLSKRQVRGRMAHPRPNMPGTRSVDEQAWTDVEAVDLIQLLHSTRSR